MRFYGNLRIKNRDKTILAIGCGDSYVQLLSQNRDNLPENVVAPYIDIDLMNSLIHKEKFYRMCEENVVDYPDTLHTPQGNGTGIRPAF